MKHLVAALLFLSIMVISFTTPPKKIKVLFFGDSITQNGVLPDGFITKMDSIINHSVLTDSIQLIGAGISGNKVYDLYLRLESDVLDQKPDIVFIYIGINDVWHKKLLRTGTDEDKFEKFYRAIINKMQAQNIKVILCTPTVIGEKKNNINEQDSDLNKYSTIVRNLSKEFSLSLLDLRKILFDYLQANNPSDEAKGILTVDGVHLNGRGNSLVAEQMWKVLQKELSAYK